MAEVDPGTSLRVDRLCNLLSVPPKGDEQPLWTMVVLQTLDEKTRILPTHVRKFRNGHRGGHHSSEQLSEYLIEYMLGVLSAAKARFGERTGLGLVIDALLSKFESDAMSEEAAKIRAELFPASGSAVGIGGNAIAGTGAGARLLGGVFSVTLLGSGAPGIVEASLREWCRTSSFVLELSTEPTLGELRKSLLDFLGKLEDGALAVLFVTSHGGPAGLMCLDAARREHTIAWRDWADLLVEVLGERTAIVCHGACQSSAAIGDFGLSVEGWRRANAGKTGPRLLVLGYQGDEPLGNVLGDFVAVVDELANVMATHANGAIDVATQIHDQLVELRSKGRLADRPLDYAVWWGAHSAPATLQLAQSMDTLFGGGEHCLLGDAAMTEFLRSGSKLADFVKSNFCDTHGAFRMTGMQRGARYSYGVMTALAADHFATPKAFLSADRSPSLAWMPNNLDSLVEQLYKDQGRNLQGKPSDVSEVARWWASKWYFELATTNVSHFGWHCVFAYVFYHEKALSCAASARKCAPQDREQLVRRAFFLQAFADHYLMDSFAAGHVRIPRREIIQYISSQAFSVPEDPADWINWDVSFEHRVRAGTLTKLLHDQDGHIEIGSHSPDSHWDSGALPHSGGLEVQNAEGRVWSTRCDEQLFLPLAGRMGVRPGGVALDVIYGEPAVRNVLLALAESLREVGLAFESGQEHTGHFSALNHAPYPVRTSPTSSGLDEKFPVADAKALFGAVKVVQKIPFLGKTTESEVRDILERLPRLCSQFSASVRADIEGGRPGIGRIPDAFLLGYLNGIRPAGASELGWDPTGSRRLVEVGRAGRPIAAPATALVDILSPIRKLLKSARDQDRGSRGLQSLATYFDNHRAPVEVTVEAGMVGGFKCLYIYLPGVESNPHMTSGLEHIERYCISLSVHDSEKLVLRMCGRFRRGTQCFVYVPYHLSSSEKEII